MIEIASKIISVKEKNEIIKKTIELDSGLDCFILIDTKDLKFGEIILTKLLDNIIGKVTYGTAYRDLSIALENTNSIIKNWDESEGIKGKLSIFVGILEDTDLIFSTIGNPSCYLVKKDHEIIEVTEKDDFHTSFSFISNGEIKSEEHIIICSDKLLHHVSRTDIVDSLDVENIDDVASNLEITLLQEKLKRNIGFIVIKNSYYKDSNEGSFLGVKNAFFKIGDNVFTKKIIAFYLLIKEKMATQGKHIRTVVFFIGVLVTFCILYLVLNSIVSDKNYEEFKTEMQQVYNDANSYVELAKQHVNNPDSFKTNITKAEENLATLREKNLYAIEVESLTTEISLLKKQFNLIETFDEKTENLYYSGLPEGTKKIFNIGGQIYATTSKSVIGPIADGNAKEFMFNDLGDDSFDDMFAIGSNYTFLTTKNGRVVNFGKSGTFKFYNVSGQSMWENFSNVDTFATYLYTLSDSGNQVYKHNLFGSAFDKGTAYLKDGDEATKDILDIGIDGGIYLLKKDNNGELEISKVLNMVSGYRVNKLELANFPDTFMIEEGTSSPRIIAGKDLTYVYLFLNDRFRILKPDTTNFSSTKSLTYIGQIDGLNKLLDYAIYRDGEVYLLNDKGLIYKINFEISDGKLILK